jgi:DeoR/GlpR family transcriptional regulator of sugar metabolism
MRRDEKLKEQRAAYVQEYVNSYRGSTTKAIGELTKKLFVSEATIYRDLTITIKLGGDKICNKGK